MKYVIVNYNFDPSWILSYTDDFVIYDRSDDGNDWLKNIPKEYPKGRVIRTKNVGNADYDRLTYLVDNYDHLPDVFLWSKSNLFKYISKDDFDSVKDSKQFTPLLKKDHESYSDKFGVVCFYGPDGMYYERNDSWYLGEHTSYYFPNYTSFAHEFQIPSPAYLPFAPGGNYILTRETVHKHSVDFYDRLRSILPYCQLPGEAHFCERSYYQLWR